ncbi:MAG: S9 family peptidase [Gemmataceae bacterium]
MRAAVPLLLVLCFPFAAFAEPPRSITVDDYFSVAMITQVAMSPDGKRVAFVEARWDTADDTRRTDLWVVGTDGKSPPRRLTFDRANDRNPKWLDGKLYFLGNRKRGDEKTAPYNGTTQVWTVSADGGPVQPVTRVEGGIAGFDLAAKGNAIVYQTDKTVHDNDAFAKLRAQYAKLEYGHGSRRVSELTRVDLTNWRTEKIVDASRYIREFTVTPNGAKIAMISCIDDTVIRSEGESRVDVWDSGSIVTPPTECYRAKAATPHAWLEDLAWSTDGNKFAFCAIFDGYPTEIIVGEKASEWTTHVQPRPSHVHVRGYGSPVKWHPNGMPFFVAESMGRSLVTPHSMDVLKSIPTDGSLPDQVVYAFDFDASGETGVIVKASSKEMGELYVTSWKPGGEQKKLFDLNPQAANWKMPTVKHVTWKGKDGSTCGGVLELPPDYDGKTKLPLVVAIHGGPTTSTKASLEYDPHNGRLYFSAHGYAVLQPNYRGSTGYGDKYTTDLIGNENDVDVSDIVTGVQHLVKEGIADPDRVASMGWSNGGYLTNCLITQKSLPFKLRAASSGAGIIDTVLEWGSNDEPAYPKAFKKGHPWETPDLYKKTSPTYGLGNVTTPTLIHVGGNDDRCPPANSRMLHRALKEFVNVPTELIVYPGEPHGLQKKAHRKAKMEWDLAWFEKYLKGS